MRKIMSMRTSREKKRRQEQTEDGGSGPEYTLDFFSVESGLCHRIATGDWKGAKRVQCVLGKTPNV